MVIREGRMPLALVAAGAAGVAGFVGIVWSLPLWGLAAALVYVYFERRPVGVAQPNAVVAPVSGVVTRVDDIDDPWLGRRSRRVRIRTRFPGVTPLLGPLEGLVTAYGVEDDPFDHRAEDAGLRPLLGRLLAPFGASPNCYALTIAAENGDSMVVAVSSVLPVSRLRLDHCPGERVSQGRRYAFAYFVDMVDLLVPPNLGARVEKGAQVRCGEALFGGFDAGVAAEAGAAEQRGGATS